MQDRPLRRQLNVQGVYSPPYAEVSEGEKRWHARALQLEVALTELLDEVTFPDWDVAGQEARDNARRVLEESP